MAGARPDFASAWILRLPERQLLLASLGCMSIGYILVLGSRHGAGHTLAASDLLPLLTYGLSLTGLHLALVSLGHRGDQVLTAVVAFLAGLGLLAQTRMGSFLDAQTLVPGYLIFPAGVLVMLASAGAFMDGRYRSLAAGFWVWGGLSLALVALLLATGERFRGAVYGAGLITPTEVLKVSVVLFVAGFVDRHARALGRWHPRYPFPRPEPLWHLGVFWLALAGLLLLQRDLGMAVILSLVLLVVLVAGSRRPGYLAYGLAAAGGLGYLVLGVFAHGQRRIDAWLDPFQDPTGGGWQILQGLSGMYAGGLWGEGFGEGSPGYTPIAESDFIYSVIGEELGYLGCVILVLFFLILFQRVLEISAKCRSAFGKLLGIGLMTVLATQTFLNLAGVTKLIPLTGITLPLISRGGASLLTTFASLGLLLAISDGLPPRARKLSGAPARSGVREETAMLEQGALAKHKAKRPARGNPGVGNSKAQDKNPTKDIG